MPSIGSVLSCPQEPVQLLNDTASQAIGALACAISTVNVIYDRLFGGDNAKQGQNAAEPSNLDSRLNLIRGMAQELETKVSFIQSRV